MNGFSDIALDHIVWVSLWSGLLAAFSAVLAAVISHRRLKAPLQALSIALAFLSGAVGFAAGLASMEQSSRSDSKLKTAADEAAKAYSRAGSAIRDAGRAGERAALADARAASASERGAKLEVQSEELELELLMARKAVSGRNLKVAQAKQLGSLRSECGEGVAVQRDHNDLETSSFGNIVEDAFHDAGMPILPYQFPRLDPQYGDITIYVPGYAGRLKDLLDTKTYKLFTGWGFVVSPSDRATVTNPSAAYTFEEASKLDRYPTFCIIRINTRPTQRLSGKPYHATRPGEWYSAVKGSGELDVDARTAGHDRR